MAIEQLDAIVIGAGVVGLACARGLARSGLETVILERHGSFGTETSARSSEVIHAGIHYPPGSLKARLCTAGSRQLYRYCEAFGVNYRRCGKLIVATSPEQGTELAAIQANALANGVEDIEALTARAAARLEPYLRCSAALHFMSTGIIDSHGLMLSLLGDAERHGAVLALKSPVLSGECVDNGMLVQVGGAEPSTLSARYVVNAAGLSAPAVAASIKHFPSAFVPSAYFAKGSYFALSGRAPFSRLVYPVPEPGGLGVHLTLDLAGQARFGPDVEWVDEIDYAVGPERGRRFYAEIRKYWPDLPDGALQPAYAGIRPKISGPGEVAADFVIQGPETHGVHGLVNLFGIESPGLTSCLAIADAVCDRLCLLG
jgi:L-2-hydroxyglutarate oxidase LhgO